MTVLSDSGACRNWPTVEWSEIGWHADCFVIGAAGTVLAIDWLGVIEMTELESIVAVFNIALWCVNIARVVQIVFM